MKKIRVIFKICLTIIFFISCSTVSTKVVYESNYYKNLAAENSQSANEYVKKIEYKKALVYLEESLRYNKLADNISGISLNYADIGKVWLLMNDFNKGLSYYNLAKQTIDNESGEGNYQKETAYILNALGEAHYLLKEYEKSKDYFNKALEIENKLKNRENIAIIYMNFAKIEKSVGNYKKALGYFLNSTGVLEKLYKKKLLNNIKNLGLAYYSVGHLYSKLNNPNNSEKYLKMALKIDKMVEDINGIADDYYGLAIIQYRKNNFKKAQQYFIKSKDIYKILDNLSQYILINDYLLDIYQKDDALDKYLSILEENYLLHNKDENIKQTIIDILKNPDISKYLSDDDLKRLNEKYK
ncbi:MAG TPA: tetratricopeptide repeat protein [Spirochaetota bacterium]|nr:tetratricopeptide repeat protein [Spirochaetota bacterium]HOS32208.1 tetratricopeptide repeat protein [Spirochaetota bacterium]HOS55647.1 tetratricopeptide repeat protein [Spirochaetota bacterium]HPK60920.1 tetratricopeptide repeat protein [Spirochaetota bacterium]HQF78171.1 tetratricopeptide repeat protein [Spirochaetota bacterium]